MDKVSVIVPVYKVENYLQRCVAALMEQTHTNLEMILVDDGSPDGCGALCDQLAEKDNRIVVIHQENQGVSVARNRGLDAMTGDWVCFCDGDDWFAPEFVEKLLACAKQEAADYIFCDYQLVGEGKEPIASHSTSGFTSGCDMRRVIACGPVSSCTHLIHKSLFDASGVRYPAGLRQFEELPVIPVLAKYSKRVGVVDEPLYNYFQRGDGTSASNAAASFEKNFLASWELMADALGEGYEKELEYHIIYSLFYGEILNLCKLKTSGKEIRQRIDAYLTRYPQYAKNPYLGELGTAKKLFIKMMCLRFVPGLRALAWVHSKIVN